MYDKEMDFHTCHVMPARRYILATMPRSGSTLCSIRLWQSGQLGAPLEYLNFRLAEKLLRRLGYNLDQNAWPKDSEQMLRYWRNLQQLRSSPNQVFGCKMFIRNLWVMAKRYPEFLSKLAPTNVIYLSRMDLVGQAISYCRAQQTKAWFGGARAAEAPDYNFKQIQFCLASICQQMAMWERLFERWGVTPLRVYYEQLCRPRQMVGAVKAHLRIRHDPAAKLSMPLLKRQADSVSEEWRARFKNDVAKHKESLVA